MSLSGHQSTQKSENIKSTSTHTSSSSSGRVPEHPAVHTILQLQQYLGNRSFSRMLLSNQTLLQRYPRQRDNISQAPTLGESGARADSLPSSNLTKMDPVTFDKLYDSQRMQWYLDKLGAYQNQIAESAVNNKVPPQLIATVILNELADINTMDVIQQGMSGSLGIAQIQVSTATRDRLVHIPGDDARLDQDAQSEWELDIMTNMDQPLYRPRSRSGIRTGLENRMVTRRLEIPQFAIEAVTREIRVLLNNMIIKRSNPWQQKFKFNLTDISQLASPNDIYQFVDGSNQLNKEWNMAEMITAAYNSPDIINAVRQQSIEEGEGFVYQNARIHGGNSRMIAGDLFVMKLFHSL